MSISLCSTDSAPDFATFQLISIRDEVLLTCCPPAPDDRDALMSSSALGIAKVSSTTSEVVGSAGTPAG
jgi:hypothetical protein